MACKPGVVGVFPCTVSGFSLTFGMQPAMTSKQHQPDAQGPEDKIDDGKHQAEEFVITDFRFIRFAIVPDCCFHICAV